MLPAGLPRDPAQWLALVLAVAVLVFAERLSRLAPRRGFGIAIVSILAAMLSAAYVTVYLRGGPRVIDATSYLLEARAMAEGYFAWPLDAPETSTLGRFLVRSEGPDGARGAVIFPPGYPALLAAGVLAGIPMAIGPLLAAAITAVTYDLANSATKSLHEASVEAPPMGVPALAVVFSVTCAALCYHTADTMSHGLAALCFAAALALIFRALDTSRAPRRAHTFAAAAGVAAGWLFATRPVSAFALAAALLAAIFFGNDLSPRARRHLLLALLVGFLPGMTLLIAHQHAATGAFGLSSQALYYARSDGPAGCFRYGFGARIGCLFEHGDFVRARLQGGYGPVAAAGTTLRRLYLHLLDPANAAPLALLVPVGAFVARRSPRVRVLALAVVAQIAAYVPFYFDGNYPGGGARFFADVLPLEHVLIAVAVAQLAARTRRPAHVAASAVALSLVGFAFHAGVNHASLRDREGGRPMFDPNDLAAHGITAGLVFIDTDHGFNLAFDPASSIRRSAEAGGLEFLRFHGDDLDRLVWETRGRPPAFRYRFAIPDTGLATVSIEPLAFSEAGALIIEGESLWPPLEQRAGWAAPEYASGTCASASRWLALHADAEGVPATARLSLPAAAVAGSTLTPRVAIGPGARGELTLLIDGATVRAWPLSSSSTTETVCVELPEVLVPPSARRVELVLLRRSGEGAYGAPLALDRIRVDRRKSFDR